MVDTLARVLGSVLVVCGIGAIVAFAAAVILILAPLLWADIWRGYVR